ncbi:MAG TPA: AAA family ATPase [Paracoccaceae bacterium]|nr:AAA family ATPase [Paracoccaceae bacterium]
MQFTKLRLVGFKSFVDPTEFTIAPGLTGVVGPNGCGKSNLLEALGWVMGESRPTAIRGDGMEDVIFAGSNTRPARNAAEVTLVLDNSQRRAPASFNAADQIEVVRRITRDAGSVFRANGREARARDIQMLFADASTGATSPALVRQGQIAELIHARPKARRRILEEAAGISGLYQRRHEAELKLSQTEANLTRVSDVLDQLDQQLASLARQARQAGRYREIARELRRAEALLLYAGWQAAEAERLRSAEALREAVRAVARAEVAAGEARRARAEAEAVMPALREEEAIAAALVQRLTIERAQLAEAEGRVRQALAETGARLGQIARDREREQGLLRDASETLARLKAEEAALAAGGEGDGAGLAAAEAAALEAGEALAAREAESDRLAQDAARLGARRQAAERRHDEARKALARLEREAEAARVALEAAERELAAMGPRCEAARVAEAAAEAARAEAEAGLKAAEAARGAAQAEEAEARVALSLAEGEAKAIGAELAAIERLLGREGEAGGQILDSVRAAPGFEAALGAALADDLQAPQIGAEGRTGWALMPELAAAAAFPPGIEPLAAHVTAPPVLARRLAAIGLVAQAEGAWLQALLAPGQRLVSREGDLWRWDGFRVAAEEAPSAAAQRLQSRNRRDALAAELARAAEVAEAARGRHGAARAALEAANAAEAAARAGRRKAEEEAASAARARNRAEAEAETLKGRCETLGLGLARREEERQAASAERQAAEAALPGLEDEAELRAAQEAARRGLEAARQAMLAARGEADRIRREGEARERRRREVRGELKSWAGRREQAEKRLADLDARAAAAAAERVASAAREARARSEALSETAVRQAETAAEHIRAETEAGPEALLTAIGADAADLPSREALEFEVARLRRAREALGAVNLRAEEDRAEVEAERAALARERADLEEAIAKLRLGIAELNREGRSRLLAAFEGVNRNFASLFRHLFGGGEANLVLVESEDPLDAGLEIMCMPPGKKLSTLSLLSGGEQTLTALSLIFAVFLANPAPICVLDEVDAPLDDANVTRFCDLLDEMARLTNTRFLIITHHAVTMSRMDRLYGVTMAERGVSQLVSVDLRQAGELVEG